MAHQVENLVATGTDPTTVTLSWDDAPDLTGEVYDIERNGSIIETAYAGTHTVGAPYTDTNSANVEYTYRVRAWGGVEASFSPPDITGLVGWYDFSDIASLFQDAARTSVITADGQIILGVADKSGAGLHMSVAVNGPTYKVNIQGGNSVAQFDGSNDILSASISADTTRTIFLCTRKRSAASGARAYLDIADVRIYNSAGQTIGFSHIPTETLFPGSIDCQTAAIYVVRDNSAASTDLYTSGQAAVNGDTHPNWQSATTMDIGSRAAGLEPTDCDMYEILVYNSALIAADINQAGDYLATKWSLTWDAIS